jgi:hypothetical protein
VLILEGSECTKGSSRGSISVASLRDDPESPVPNIESRSPANSDKQAPIFFRPWLPRTHEDSHREHGGLIASPNVNAEEVNMIVRFTRPMSRCKGDCRKWFWKSFRPAFYPILFGS